MPSKYPARNLTQEQIDQCLLVLAEHGGDASRAREQLEEVLGHATPSRSTLDRWRRTLHVDRYHQIVNGLERVRRDEKLVQGFREASQRSLSAVSGIFDRFDLDSMEQKDMPRAATEFAKVAGIATQNTLLLEGRPTAITEVRNPDWYAEQARELGLDLDEEEIEDAEVVD